MLSKSQKGRDLLRSGFKSLGSRTFQEDLRSWIGLLSSTAALVAFFGEIIFDQNRNMKFVAPVVIAIFTAKAFQRSVRTWRFEVLSDNPQIPTVRLILGEGSPHQSPAEEATRPSSGSNAPTLERSPPSSE